MRSVIPLFFCVTVCSAFATTPAYTKAQAVQGASLYKTNCAMCHGSALNNGGAPKLAGPEFLHYIMSTTMPQTKPGGLKPDQYLSLIAYVLQKNGYKAGTTALKATNLKQYTFKN
jgi:mono/diheme cytochrome c family protein